MKQHEICFSTDFLREMCMETKGFSTLQLHRDRVLFMFSLFWVHFSPFSTDSGRFLQDDYILMLHFLQELYTTIKFSHLLGPFFPFIRSGLHPGTSIFFDYLILIMFSSQGLRNFTPLLGVLIAWPAFSRHIWRHSLYADICLCEADRELIDYNAIDYVFRS